MVISEMLSTRKYILYDGAMGTMLYDNGLKPGENPVIMNIKAPEVVERIHKMYIEAGSDIICANTFAANALSLEGLGYSPAEVIEAAVKIAKRAACVIARSEATKQSSPSPPFVALDIGSTGQILEPAGDLSFESAIDIFKEMAIAGEIAGADLAALETFSDIEELTAAATAIRENTKLPIFATMTFEKSGYTYMGATPEKFTEAAENLGIAAIGINCSLQPLEMTGIAKRIADTTKLPLIIKPNAGLPDAVSGQYNVGAQEFARQMLEFKQFGVKIVGGCCGTTPDHIKALKEAFV